MRRVVVLPMAPHRLGGEDILGGLDLIPGASRIWPADVWTNHDRVARENFVNVGGGLGWSINDTLDVFASFTKAVSARNTHVLDRAVVTGVSIRGSSRRPSAARRAPA